MTFYHKKKQNNKKKYTSSFMSTENSFFKRFLLGGDSPDEFYYLESENGRKTYYLLRNDSIIRETKDFPKDLLSKIQKRDDSITKAMKKHKLLLEKKKWHEKIEAIKRNNIAKLDKELESYNDVDCATVLNDYANHKKRVHAIHHNEFLRKLFGNFNTAPDKATVFKFLNDNKITDKPTLHKWLKENHPDKNKEADEELCKRIISEAQKCGLLHN